jgi:4-hydroxythreonine-4-phosphate dehydrogenase
MKMKPILITVGDPAGVGAEVALKALRKGAAKDRPVALVGPPSVWRRAAEAVGAGDQWPIWADAEPFVFGDDPADPGDARLAERGRALVRAIDAAARACLAGRTAAMVTMPIDKRALRAGGAEYPGHTEFIADLCGVARPVMMLFGLSFRVAPLTTHLALRDVPARLTVDDTFAALQIIHRDLQRLFGIAAPRLALCGLNPHAGEGGLFGDEEQRILGPAAARARGEGIAVDGPAAADGVFARRRRYDAIVCPTHDQALIPLKLLHFNRAVNVTLGLPIVRTSPDHGTARDVAWRGKADAGSAFAAIRAAVDFADMLSRAETPRPESSEGVSSR